MKKYDFDKITDRYGTGSLKFDFIKQWGKPDGILPLWVADMDFPAPPEVLDDIQKAVSHGIFGYTEPTDDYYRAVGDWFQKRFDYTVRQSEIITAPGIVFALAQMILAYTEAGDSVMIQTPVYYPFYDVVLDNGRKLVKNPLIYKNGGYTIDFAGFENQIKKEQVRLFILCSPHNPVGRVWTRAELIKLNRICVQYNVIIISDEIHCDFIYGENKHLIFGHINDSAVICTAPSKTFNLAGLQVSNIFIKNKNLRQKLKYQIKKSGYSQLNTLGLAACRSAYEKGSLWLEELKEYLWANYEFTKDFLSRHMPEIKLIEPQGTYLLWLDFSAYNLSQKELDELIVNKAKLWLSSGVIFGKEGEGFQRINIACPQATLGKALLQLEKTVRNI